MFDTCFIRIKISEKNNYVYFTMYLLLCFGYFDWSTEVMPVNPEGPMGWCNCFKVKVQVQHIVELSLSTTVL